MQSDYVRYHTRVRRDFPADAVCLNASAVVDPTSGGWMIVGARKFRSRLVAAFVGDGCRYVSDYQLLVRPAPHQREIIVLTSPVDVTPQAVRADSPPELPRERRVAAAQLRGVLLAIGAAPHTPSAWHAVSQEHARAWLIDAAPDLNSNDWTAEPFRALMAACMARPAIAAGLAQDTERVKGSALGNLVNAVHAIL